MAGRRSWDEISAENRQLRQATRDMMDCCKRLKHDADATISSLITHMNSKLKPKHPQQRETKSTVATLSKPEQQNTDAFAELQKRFEAEQNRWSEERQQLLSTIAELIKQTGTKVRPQDARATQSMTPSSYGPVSGHSGSPNRPLSQSLFDLASDPLVDVADEHTGMNDLLTMSALSTRNFSSAQHQASQCNKMIQAEQNYMHAIVSAMQTAFEAHVDAERTVAHIRKEAVELRSARKAASRLAQPEPATTATATATTTAATAATTATATTATTTAAAPAAASPATTRASENKMTDTSETTAPSTTPPRRSRPATPPSLEQRFSVKASEIERLLQRCSQLTGGLGGLQSPPVKGGPTGSDPTARILDFSMQENSATAHGTTESDT